MLDYGKETCSHLHAHIKPEHLADRENGRAIAAIIMASFVPRKAFPLLASLPRSYYLGHHAAGLSKMKTLLSSIDLVIECRDYGHHLCPRNPLFEENLGERPRLIVYTKQDLGSQGLKKALKVCATPCEMGQR